MKETGGVEFKTPGKVVNLKMGGAKNESEKPRKMRGAKLFSNDPLMSVKVFCNLCDNVYAMSGLRKHLAHKHSMTATKYASLFGHPRKQIIQKIYHNCAICKEEMLLDTDFISRHTQKQHRLGYTSYTRHNMNKGSGLINGGDKTVGPVMRHFGWRSNPRRKPKPQKQETQESSSMPEMTPAKKSSSSALVMPPTPPATPPNTDCVKVEPEETPDILVDTPLPSSSTSLVIIQCDLCFKIFDKNIKLKAHKKKNH